MLHRRMIAIAGLGLLAACHGTQPTIEQTNVSTNAELSSINASITSTDGMDQGNAALLTTPTPGQVMDAKEQPPK